MGISDRDYMRSSHPYNCTCSQCRPRRKKKRSFQTDSGSKKISKPKRKPKPEQQTPATASQASQTSKHKTTPSSALKNFASWWHESRVVAFFSPVRWLLASLGAGLFYLAVWHHLEMVEQFPLAGREVVRGIRIEVILFGIILLLIGLFAEDNKRRITSVFKLCLFLAVGSGARHGYMYLDRTGKIDQWTTSAGRTVDSIKESGGKIVESIVESKPVDTAVEFGGKAISFVKDKLGDWKPEIVQLPVDEITEYTVMSHSSHPSAIEIVVSHPPNMENNRGELSEKSPHNPTPTPFSETKGGSLPESPSNFTSKRVWVGKRTHIAGVWITDNRKAKNPTFDELIEFLRSDDTDTLEYKMPSFVCSDFAVRLHNNAEKQGIRCAYVSIDFKVGAGHALNAFQTTDKGLIFVDCTGGDAQDRLNYKGSMDSIVQVCSGKVYLPADLPGKNEKEGERWSWQPMGVVKMVKVIQW